MKKKSIFGCLAIICLLLVLIPPVLTRAEKHSLITWEKKSKNVVSMYLELQEKEAFEEIKAFSLTLNICQRSLFLNSDLILRGRRYRFMKNGTMRKIKP